MCFHETFCDSECDECGLFGLNEFINLSRMISMDCDFVCFTRFWTSLVDVELIWLVVMIVVVELGVTVGLLCPVVTVWPIPPRREGVRVEVQKDHARRARGRRTLLLDEDEDEVPFRSRADTA